MSKNNRVTKSSEIAGRTLSFEVGHFAPRATSSVLAKYGDTSVLATVVVGNEDPKKDYFPLSVEYQERLYAGGRIKGSRWVKREGKGTDAEVLSGRLTDRSIRPLFPSEFKNEVQVVLTVLSVDNENDPDILALNAASAAIAISSAPWNGPVAATRVGLDDQTIVINPKNGKNLQNQLDLVVASSESLITMIEAGAKQVPEDTMSSALTNGFNANKQIIDLINELVSEVGHQKITVAKKDYDAKLLKKVQSDAKSIIDQAFADAADKSVIDREHVYEQAKSTLAATYEPAEQSAAKDIIDQMFTSTFRDRILDKNIRADGRKLDQIRPLTIEVDVIPRVHGSAVFQRGETQALTITTLGAPSLYQSLESAEGEDQKRYMHHYNFPPFSTGETGRMGGPGRREVGHGALAERALQPVIPAETNFPYAIRVVSEILSSYGSSSMASTCGSTLSLMSAGVPLVAPVAGISTGLITSADYPKKTDKYCLLTDINGGEDHYGDMDFKVAGTEKGITAIQLDVKVPGLTLEICEQTLKTARVARMEILQKMLAVIKEPRASISQYAPQIKTLTIPVDKIGELIGPGGKNIKKLMADTESMVDVRDDGSVFITGVSAEGVAKAMTYIEGLGKEVMPGEIYEGTVVKLQPFGAFVNILPGKDGLVHVSQMAQGFVSSPEQIVQEGQTVRVWVVEIDSQGRLSLSMLFDEAGQPIQKARESQPRSEGPRSNDRGGHFSGPRPRRDRR